MPGRPAWGAARRERLAWVAARCESLGSVAVRRSAWPAWLARVAGACAWGLPGVARRPRLGLARLRMPGLDRSALRGACAWGLPGVARARARVARRCEVPAPGAGRRCQCLRPGSLGVARRLRPALRVRGPGRSCRGRLGLGRSALRVPRLGYLGVANACTSGSPSAASACGSAQRLGLAGATTYAGRPGGVSGLGAPAPCSARAGPRRELRSVTHHPDARWPLIMRFWGGGARSTKGR
jgi:hypothetical protein